MKNKKGVELTMNTMIIAIISLIVLAVILIIFSNTISDNTDGLAGISSCEARGEGSGCVKKIDDCEDGTALPKVGCPDSELSVCCIRNS